MAEAPQFVVSARKYRPATFSTVVGQSHITNTLKNAIASNHLAQAFLFCGPRGVGKTTCARILAKALNCTERSDEQEPCNHCQSCQSFNQNANFNIHELDAASNNSVEDIRALVEQVRFPPHNGKYKVYIIDEVHMLSTAAFNAFLKTLEEPPSYAIFIMATTEKHKILPTILSRCQIFEFNRIKVEDIAGQLRHVAASEGIIAEDEALYVIAQKADGGMRDALSMFDLVSTFDPTRAVTLAGAVEHLNVLDYEYYFAIANHLHRNEVADALLTLDEIVRKGFDGHLFIGGFADHLRNLLLSKDAKTARLLAVPETVQKRYHEQAKLIPSSFIITCLTLASSADSQYKNARNKRLLLELALIKMGHVQEAINLVTETRKLEALGQQAGQKKNDDILVPPPAADNLTEYVAPPATPSIPKIPGIPMLGAMLKTAPEAQPVQADIIPVQPKRNTPIAEEGIIKVWMALLERMRQKGHAQETGILSTAELSVEGGNLILTGLSQHNLNEYIRAKPIWHPLLSDLLENDTFQVDMRIGTPIIPQTQNLYSDSSKLDYLVENYEGMEEWKRVLGLEV